jgi:hypothetical protein
MKPYLPLLCLVVLASCADAVEEPRLEPRPFATVVTETGENTWHGAVGVVSEPFEDVGLKRDAIPERLALLVPDPYQLPVQPVCPNVRDEIAALDELLGIQAKDDGTHPQALRDEGASVIEKQALTMLRGEVQILPFRGVVRRVSGADRHARRVIRAYEAGDQRRAFLKGIAAAYGCKL